MYLGLCTKLSDQQATPEESNALVTTRAALKRYQAEQFGETKSTNVAPDDDAAAARARGFRAGKETEIRPGVASSPARPQLT